MRDGATATLKKQAFGVMGPRFSQGRRTGWERQRKMGLGMPGFVRQHAGIDPDLAQRAEVFFLDVVAKNQIPIGNAMQPAIILDFSFELSRRPASVTEGEDGVFRPGALRDRLEDIDGCSQTNAL